MANIIKRGNQAVIDGRKVASREELDILDIEIREYEAKKNLMLVQITKIDTMQLLNRNRLKQCELDIKDFKAWEIEQASKAKEEKDKNTTDVKE